MSADNRILKATLLLGLLSMSFALMAQEKAPATSEPVKILTVRFVNTYQMCAATADATEGKVIAAIETNLTSFKNPDWTRLDNYEVNYSAAGSKASSAVVFAIGEQMALQSGDVMQAWIHRQEKPSGMTSYISTDAGGMVAVPGAEVGSCVVDSSQIIHGITILVAMPKTATSFTLKIKPVGFASQATPGPAAKK